MRAVGGALSAKQGTFILHRQTWRHVLVAVAALAAAAAVTARGRWRQRWLVEPGGLGGTTGGAGRSGLSGRRHRGTSARDGGLPDGFNTDGFNTDGLNLDAILADAGITDLQKWSDQRFGLHPGNRHRVPPGVGRELLFLPERRNLELLLVR